MVRTSISIGELLDKISILQIKKERISDDEKLNNIVTELNELNKALNMVRIVQDLAGNTSITNSISALYHVNNIIWEIEDSIRDKERKQEFDDQFIQLARGVYINNDTRARLKKEINVALSSGIVEEKSYTEYQTCHRR